ncbi:MAG: hypothetical protein F4X98_12690 [Gammaproteobacteria bacterium]|nr:hypothetical protein [Gammaproteobacteria bacterium]
MTLDLARIRATRDAAAETVQRYQIIFTLNADRIASLGPPSFPLHWESIKFDDPAQIGNIPNNKRGVYAFVVAAHASALPTHGYIMYIGIAGRRSARSLRARYRDYLNTNKVLERPEVMRMIATWHDVLRFFYAPVDNKITSAQLESLERALNTVWMPPCVERDVDAATRAMQKAFP